MTERQTRGGAPEPTRDAEEKKDGVLSASSERVRVCVCFVKLGKIGNGNTGQKMNPMSAVTMPVFAGADNGEPDVRLLRSGRTSAPRSRSLLVGACLPPSQEKPTRPPGAKGYRESYTTTK